MTRKQEQELAKNLKPCPFCGGKAKIENFEPWKSVYWAWCEECGSTGAIAETPGKAVDAWNRRVSDES